MASDSSGKSEPLQDLRRRVIQVFEIYYAPFVKHFETKLGKRKAALHASTMTMTVASKPRESHAPKRRDDALSEPRGGFLSVIKDGNSQRSRRKIPVERND